MLDIVIPIAGRGSRFTDAGYASPKPLIPVHEHPMIELVINNLRPRMAHRFIFLALAEHLQTWPLADLLDRVAPGCIVVPVTQVTEGAACTVLLAEKHIDHDEPLMIANCDQWIDIDINDYLAAMDDRDLDGLIMTMYADDPKWSYARTGPDGFVDLVVEKQVISKHATVGIYNFRRGSDFVASAKSMIARDLRVNNEFYVAPAYNQMIGQGARIGVYDVGPEFEGMYGMGIPQDLEKFLACEASRRAVAHC